MKKYVNIGILTWHHYSNYGSVLQAYSVQEIFRQRGFSTVFLNYHSGSTKSTLFKKILKFVLLNYLGPESKLTKKFLSCFSCFRYSFLDSTKEVNSKRKLIKLCSNVQIISVGSDQIWAPNVLDDCYLLYDMPITSKKISLSASIGLNEIPESMQKIYKKSLTNFDFISVREKKGKQILEEIIDNDIYVFLDPTLLMPASFWNKKISNISNFYNVRYVFCYFLKKNNNYNEFVNAFCKKHNCVPVLLGNNSVNSCINNVVIADNPSPFEWIKLISSSYCVLTDSFHGTAFAINMSKNFYTFKRFENNDKICQNSRIENILGILNLSNHFISCNSKNYDILDIDYECVQANLTKIRNNQLEILYSEIERLLND